MGRSTARKILKKTVSLALVVALGISTVGAEAVYGGELVSAKTETEAEYEYTYTADEYTSERISMNYTKVSSQYTFADYSGEDIVINVAEDVIAGADKLTADTRAYSQSDKVLDLTIGDMVSFEVEVPQDGKYFVNFNYLSYDESILPVAMAMQVDGAYPFYECRNLEFETTWKQDTEPTYDRYGNEVVTVPDKVIQWEEKYLMDASYRHSEALLVELTAGTHTISLEVKEGTFLLGNITLEAPHYVPEYTGSQVAEGKEIITLQGEDYTTTNSSSIHAIAEYDTSLYPYSVTDKVLNTIDSDSFGVAGQSVTYEFNVDVAGYYYIAANYRASEKNGFPVFIDVAIDGEIPNTALQSYALPYTTGYKTSTLEDSAGEYISVYLEKGTHTITFTLSMDPICYVMEAIDEIMSEINDLALEITKVAGTNADKYRDLQLSRYIPNIESDLYSYAAKLEELEDSALQFVNGKKSVAVMASMLIAAGQLESLADEPDEIPYRIAELSTSNNSANHYLANTIDSLIKNDLAIDRIYIYQQDAKLPKAPGFFKSGWMNVQRFVSSFTDQDYSTANTDPNHLQVWVNRPNQYIQLMQKMIDEQFTPQTGIEVDISVMPDQYKLVLSNSSGNTPDVATGINYTIPYEIGIRGALVDMTQFADFKEVAAPYETGFFMTGCINGGIYSMPETMNFWVLFYRTDVMEKLGLEVPETMDDVIAMLPELQMRGLEFYYPTAGMLTMRNFHGTAPLLMQYGGTLYGATADLGTTIGSEESVAGFTALTDLFTIYDMPVNVDSFYQHFRNGDMPIGIADYAAFNLLSNAAPELSSSWEIALIPGTVKEDGSIDRSVCGCAESTVIFKSNSTREAQAWEFIKWWSSTEVQAEFGQTLQVTYGDEYFWPTANLDAFAQLPISADSREVIIETAKNVIDIARVPGTYLLEREMSNAFNDIVVNGDNEQTRIDEAVKTINREIDRKLEEFGYIDSMGNVIEPYVIPTMESLRELLGRTE